MSTLQLSSAELCVALSALDVNPRPFIDSSDLLAATRADLTLVLSAARESLVRRGLAAVKRDNSLEIGELVRGRLLQIVQPQTAFEMLHAQAGKPAQRIRFNFAAVSIIAHTFVDAHTHEFEQTMEIADVTRRVMAAATPPDTGNTAGGGAVTMPHATFGRLARTPPDPDAQLMALLEGAGLNAELAAGVLKAGSHPTHQTVFTALAQRGNKLQSRAIMWFSDADSCWLITDFNQHGNVVMMPATAPTIHQAVDAMIAASL